MKVCIDDITGFEPGYTMTDIAVNSITDGIAITPIDPVKGIITYSQWLNRLIYENCKAIERHWEMVFCQRD
jgi:hypothetical protein